MPQRSGCTDAQLSGVYVNASAPPGTELLASYDQGTSGGGPSAGVLLGVARNVSGATLALSGLLSGWSSVHAKLFHIPFGTEAGCAPLSPPQAVAPAAAAVVGGAATLALPPLLAEDALWVSLAPSAAAVRAPW